MKLLASIFLAFYFHKKDWIAYILNVCLVIYTLYLKSDNFKISQDPFFLTPGKLFNISIFFQEGPGGHDLFSLLN